MTPDAALTNSSMSFQEAVMITDRISSDPIATTFEEAGPTATCPEQALALWERIALKMTGTLCLEEVLRATTQGLVDEFGEALVRIWMIGPGDLCKTCSKA